MMYNKKKKKMFKLFHSKKSQFVFHFITELVQAHYDKRSFDQGVIYPLHGNQPCDKTHYSNWLKTVI